MAVAEEKELNELIEKQEWWWLAEKTRSSRLDYLRKAVWKKGAIGGRPASAMKLDVSFGKRQMELHKEFRFEPHMLRRAKVFAGLLEYSPIYITDQAQIVGSFTCTPSTAPWYADTSSMGNNAVYNAHEILPEPLEESLEIVNEVSQYWGGQSVIEQIARYLDPEDAAKFFSGAIAWGAPLGGYSGKNYEYYMTGERAFEDIIRQLEANIEEAEEATLGDPSPDLLPIYSKIHNWEAMIIVLEASIKWAKRYARLARIIAENFEADPKRKEELLRLAETCDQVPAKPPRTLQESLQYDHFIQVLARRETYEGAWPARPDYYHGPYYEKDVVEERTSPRRRPWTCWASS